jgi:hypothetical protein
MCDRMVSRGYVPGITQAIKNGRIEVVRYMLENGYVNTAEMDVLGIAAEYGHSSIIKLTLEYGAQLNMTHLLRTLSKKNTSMFSTLSLLFESGVPMDEEIYCGDDSALYHALFVACNRLFHIQDRIVFPPLDFKWEWFSNGLLIEFKNKDKIIAQEARKKIPEAFAGYKLLDQLFAEVAHGGAKLLSEPFDFQHVTQDLRRWLKDYKVRLRSADELYFKGIESGEESDALMKEKNEQRPAVAREREDLRRKAPWVNSSALNVAEERESEARRRSEM